MLRLQLKLAWRSLVRNRSFSLISILGLSGSVAFCLLLMLHTQYELSFDAFHRNRDRLFRLEMTDFLNFSGGGDDSKAGAGQLLFPFAAGPVLKQSFPEIENVDRVQFYSSPVFVRARGAVFKENRVLLTDENFFSMLSFKLLAGSPGQALREADDVVLSESTARRYFGTTDVAGKSLEIRMDSVKLYRVTGVVEDAPANSSIRYDLIFPNSASPDYRSWAASGVPDLTHLILVQLKAGVAAETFSKELTAWQRDYFAKPYAGRYGKNMPDFNFSQLKWWVRPLADGHYEASQPWGHYTNWKSLELIYGIALVVLVIAALNYILLVVATAATRMQELGIRKVMGAKRWDLAVQFWVETVLIVLFACLLGLLLAWVSLPAFNEMIGSDLRAGLPLLGLALALLPGFVFGLATVASLYPALLLSGADPLAALKRFGTFRFNPSFGKGLVVFQFGCCAVLLCAALVIGRQMRYMSDLDLGFDKRGVLLVRNQAFDLPFVRAMDDRFREAVRRNPAFTGYSTLSGDLGGDGGMQNGMMVDGKVRLVIGLDVGYDYFNLLQIPLLEGRSFSRSYVTDTSLSKPVCVVNETLFRMLGKSAKVGAFNRSLNATIIGVAKDYHISRLDTKILPVEHLLATGSVSYYLFRVRAAQLDDAIRVLRQTWSEGSAAYPFEFSFLDQRIAAMYESDRNRQRMMEAACLLAAVISCMGLFGLSAVTVVNYRKDVGIRKILGAGDGEIVYYLSRNFMSMVLLALAAGLPVGWYLMRRWLDGFAYRTTLQPLLFVEVAMVLIGIASLSIAWHVVRGARANVVKSLRVD
jgi:putative ABC transport system permease protein